MDDDRLAELPHEMLSFVLRHVETKGVGPRLGQLRVRGRSPTSTPNYVVGTSRGVLPHVAHDVFEKHTNIAIAYVGLEDFIEKQLAAAPIFKQPSRSGSKFRTYTSLSDRCIVILGPRRVPRLACPGQNTSSSIAISTSVGFDYLDVEGYIDSGTEFGADITTSIVDLVSADRISAKRLEKSADRTHAWLRDTVEGSRDKNEYPQPLFASIPPLGPEQQSLYLSDLQDEFREHISGVCLYDPATSLIVPTTLQNTPRLCLSDPQSPHDVLQAISWGVDLLTVPFVTAASEKGIALSFSLMTEDDAKDEPLGFNLWDTDHRADLSALVPSCQCYACTRHHRAYIHHLLTAREMLAWTLLQIHNHHVIDTFFAQIRQHIENNQFEEAKRVFYQKHQTDLPQSSGEGPRIRGYQHKSIGKGEPKLNTKAYNRLDDQAQKLAEAESGVATPDADSKVLEKQGFADRSE